MNSRDTVVLRRLQARLPQRGSGDAGVSLLAALIFVSVMSLVIAGLLGYASSAIKSVKYSSAATGTTYDADGALKATIATLRQSAYFNKTSDTNCDNAFKYPGVNGARTVKVVCQGAVGTGDQSDTVKIKEGLNVPGVALVLLGENSWEKGLWKQKNNVLRVQGGLAINGTVVQDGGTYCPSLPQPPTDPNCAEIYVTKGAATVGKACSPVLGDGGSAIIYADRGARCDVSGSPAVDPGLTPPSGSLTYRPVPPCPASPGNKTLTFQGGYYDDAVTLTDRIKSCGVKAFSFPDPVYYFDFKNDETSLLPATSPIADSHIWKISTDVKVVAGEPLWDVSPGASTVTVPGACKSPEQGTNTGTVFVFGGDSRLEMTRGSLEICGQFYEDKPPITLAGVPGATGNPAPTTSSIPPTGTVTNPTGMDANFAPAPSATIVSAVNETSGLLTASWKVKRNSNETVGLNLNGLVTTPNLPAGSIVTGADLLIRHRLTLSNDPGKSPPTFRSATATMTPIGGGAAFDVTVTPPTAFPAVAADEGYSVYPLPASVGQSIHDGNFSGFNVQYRVGVRGSTDANQPAAVDVDAVKLRVRYIPPTLRGQAAVLPNGRSCIVPAASTDPTCKLIKTTGSTTNIHFQGMTYVPKAALALTLNDKSVQIFRWGIVARTLEVDTPASFSTTEEVVQVPVERFGKIPALVYMRAYVCRVGRESDCASSSPPGDAWELQARAAVTFANPAEGKNRRVNIVAWESAP